jgi:hypothetical protein
VMQYRMSDCMSRMSSREKAREIPQSILGAEHDVQNILCKMEHVQPLLPILN